MQVAALRADASAAEALQAQVAALSPQAEQLPALKALAAKMQASSKYRRKTSCQTMFASHVYHQGPGSTEGVAPLLT